MSVTMEFTYGIRDEVAIKAINTVGIVDGISIENSLPMFRVVYWNDGERNAVWVYEWELQTF